MSLWEDYEFDPFDDEERTVTCKHCGMSGLEWVETHKGWRPFTVDDEIHKCNRNDDPTRAFAVPLK